jgi:preprotein translocase subunit SecG
MQTVVIVIHLMVVLGLTGLVLLQRSEGGGLGMGGGGGGFLTSRGTSNVLTRSTAILAAIFFATSLLLSILAGMDRKPRSILNSGSPSAPLSTPSLPLGQGRTTPEPATPATPAPSGPQVPRSQ